MSINAAEAILTESKRAISPFREVKTNTSRFPREELAQTCCPSSGDWATMTSRFHAADDTFADVMGVAHRRGLEVHTFSLSTMGKTMVGRPQTHKYVYDDMDADTGFIVARKCPKVLNCWTQAQPKKISPQWNAAV